MLTDTPSETCKALLSSAQKTMVIDGWEMLGWAVVLRRGDSNIYVTPDTLERALQKLRADC